MAISRSLITETSNRFIPSSSSTLVYKTRHKNELQLSYQSHENLDNNIPHANLSIRDDSLFTHSTSSISSNTHFQSSSSSIGSSSAIKRVTLGSTKPSDLHQKIVAEALNFVLSSKVLKFDNKSRSKKIQNRIDAKLVESLTIAEREVSVDAGKSRSTSSIKTIIATDILQAPGLRNDYYSNLVSWSFKTNRVAVGLGSKIYLWGVDNNVTQINHSNEDLVTAVSCSKEYWILVATAGGKIILMNQQSNSVVSEYTNNEGKCIFCFAWFDKSNMFIAGDDFGEVYIFKIHKLFNVQIELVRVFKCHQQQICGM